ncbi:hypothetical protein K280104A7_20490 [Candidatus Bariatricus faecipullorum]
MKKKKQIRRMALAMAVCTGLLLTGCNEEKTSQSAEEEREEQSFRESEKLAEGFRDIYEAALKEDRLDTPETAGQIVDFLGQRGYTAVDAGNRVDMVNAGNLKNFFQKVTEGETGETSFFVVTASGGFTRYDLQTSAEEREVFQSALNWEDGTPQAAYGEYWPMEGWVLTENWLFFSRTRPAGYDGPPGDMAVRLEPLEEECRSACRQYLEPLGYGRNNLFFTDWTEENLDAVCLEDLYEPFYRMKYGEETKYGFDFDMTEYAVPGAELESLYQSFFRVTAETLRERMEWREDTGTYAYRPRGIDERPASDYPFPEVTDVRENPDGTRTLQVQAVWPEQKTEHAFRHELTVRPLEDGFQYVANRVLETGEGMDFSWYTRRLPAEIWKERYGGNTK